ncbi:MAG TPA: FAD-binding oxidoreductase [Clostridia bacterium]|nr:FAD-binding oxidoreductase [Clostridia bacterium]
MNFSEIFTTVISITGISVVLAIIISLADMKLNDYGICKININDGNRELEVTGGQSLLNSLAENKIFIPSACGGKATCGLCKLQVMSGAGPLLPTEEPYLTPKEREEHFRLACQVKVKGDMDLLIPEELFNIKEFRTRVDKLENLTHDIKLVRLKLPEGEDLNFKPGQFMQFYTKPYGKIKESVFRAYSISSAPSDKGYVEFCIRQVPDGVCTTYVHTALKEGDEVPLSGPYGDFYYRGNTPKMILVGGGSGLAPLRSLVLDNLEKGVDADMTLYFGAQSLRDLYYTEEFKALEEKHDNFHFIQSLSRPQEDDVWDGNVGRITVALEEDLKNMQGDGSDIEAYLCGSPGFLAAVRKLLTDNGVPASQIFFDEF